jgi:hypothetical protein
LFGFPKSPFANISSLVDEEDDELKVSLANELGEIA